ncbi:MAG: flagellar hook-basal body complex protein FliE [Candidatus Pelagadaptatus aseana]
MDISRLLVEMRSLKSQSQAFQPPQGLSARDVAAPGLGNGAAVKPSEKIPSFGELMEQAVNKVNDVQKQSSAIAKAYEQGDPNIDVSDVMIASQKSSVAFQSALQVRNKLIEAYRDVMNMPV